MEMKELVERTGGMVVQTDSFTNPIFKESLKRMFDGTATDISSNGIFEVCPLYSSSRFLTLLILAGYSFERYSALWGHWPRSKFGEEISTRLGYLCRSGWYKYVAPQLPDTFDASNRHL